MAKRALTYPRVQILKLNEIVVDPSIQPRENGLSGDTVDEYAESIRDGAKFPPLVVFHNADENRYWLSEGFHRYAAHERAERTEVECEVRFGDRLAALHNSCGSNRTHGLRRTNADKRRAIALLLAEYPTQSDRWIADAVGCDHKTVAAVRTPTKPESERSDGCTGEFPQCNHQNEELRPLSEVRRLIAPKGTDSGGVEQRRETSLAPKRNGTATKSGNDFVPGAQTSNQPDESRPTTQPPPPPVAQSARLGNRPEGSDLPDPPLPSGASLGNRPMGPDPFEVLRQGSQEYLALLNLPYANMLFAIAAGEGSKTSVCKTIEAVIQHINKKRPEKK